ncbi:hypothetical protein HPP92_007468 [Vanilla planifolia]|uniref:Timeless N-terminal domain-containing protein n=1 Tax=Vanilla planifolia TaxID=51239 RepID=A0A835RLV7_VANPL|nr:hypothetical protein HPP92_007468 [Vanilla planifolia]
MAVDPASDDVAQQIEYLWDVKAALTRKVTIAVIVSLLEEPLGHLESGTFTEDDWKLVQLILTLFRNILSIQGITVQQKASGSATRFLHLTEKLLEIMFHENAVDLILVLVQHVNDPGGYIRQINLLLLEVLHYILLGWDPELVANTFINNTKANENGAVSAESIRSIAQEEEEKRRAIRQNNVDCCLKLDGTFTRVAMDGSKMLIKGNPAAASATGLSKVRKVPRGPLKKVALDNGGSFLRQDNIRELLHTFLNQFLSGGYNDLMQTIQDDITKEHQDIQLNDIDIFFQVAHFVTAFHHKKILMIRMLDLVLKRLPEDSKECETARVMLYKLFYDQTDKGLTQFLLNLFRCFNSHKQPKSDLADLLEIIHIILRLMEKLQAYGALRVSKKLRRRTKKKASKNQNEVDSRMINKSDNAHQLSSSTSEPCLDLGKSKPENILDSNPGQSKQELHQDGVLLVSPPVESDVLENTQHVQNHSSPSHVDEENKNYADHEYETGGSSNNDEPTTNEVNFDISTFLFSFATNTVIHNLCWLLKHYKANSASTNYHIVSMIRRFCDDLELSPMFYQLSLLTTFYDILAEQKPCKHREYMHIVNYLSKFIREMLKRMKSQPLLFVEILFWKTRMECEHINAEALMGDIVKVRKDIRQMYGNNKGSTNYLGDKDYRSIADALGEDEIDLDIPSINHDRRMEQQSSPVGQSNLVQTKLRKSKRSSMADISENKIDDDVSEITPTSAQVQETSRRHNHPSFTQEQIAIISELYHKYKNEKKCSRLIADALDPVGKISPALITRKLKELGLMIAPKKKLVKVKRLPAMVDPAMPGSADNDETQRGLEERGNFNPSKASNTRKRVRAFSVEEELQITVLYEVFKNHKKRNVMIANALDPKNQISAAEVSRELKNLGLLPCEKSTSTSRKHVKDNEGNDAQHKCDEETLLMIRKRSGRKKRAVGVCGGANISSQQQQETPLGNDSDVVLSSLFNRKKRTIGVHGGASFGLKQLKETPQGNDSDDLALSSLFKNALTNDKPKAPENDRGAIENDTIQLEKSMLLGQGEEEDLNDEDEILPMAHRRMGSRRSLKMVVDFDEDD